MGSIAEKLSYLNGTKRLLRRRLNSLGAEITLETRFRDYLLWLDRFYNAASSSVDFELLGETKQYAANSSVNILPLYDDEIVTDGVTVTISNGKITINGTPERDLWIKITNGMEVEYTNPRPNDGHRWYSEKLTEFDEPTTLILQVGKGGGTVASSGNMYHLGYHDTHYPEAVTSDHLTAFADNVTEEKKISGGRYINNVTETNFVMFHLIQGELLNTYGYLSLATSSQTYWTPNYDAAPASPDNPKYFWSPDDITYTASDGTEFPIYLSYPDAPYNFILNGIGDYKDRIYYKNGKFYCERKIGSVTLDGSENWNYISVTQGNLFRNNTVITNAKDDRTYAPLCNYYRGIPLDNQSNRQSGDTYIYAVNNVVDILDNTQTTAANFVTWLSTHPTVVYYVLNEPVITEITEDNGYELYNQLKAIIDHETKLEIEKKIF